MRFDNVPPVYQAFIRDRLARAGFAPASLPLDICPDDEMFVRGVLPGYPGREGAAVYRFLESATRTFDTYSQLIEAVGGFGAIDRVLDFGSGHGRLTRTLLGKLEPRKIWASDIYHKAIAWQAETYGVNGLVSVSDPSRFALDQQHDIVFAASVFSHLPDGLFQGWLARLYDLVAPTGLLAFSVHGTGFAPPAQDINTAGIGYEHRSESITLDTGIYGMSYVSEPYVRAAIATACGDAPASATRLFRAGLFESQDLYVVPGRDRDLSALALTSVPIGSFAKTSDAGTWRGWAIDLNPAAQVIRVDVYAGERQVASVLPAGIAEEIVPYFPGTPSAPLRWSVPTVVSDEVLRAELISSTGRVGHCYAAVLPNGQMIRS